LSAIFEELRMIGLAIALTVVAAAAPAGTISPRPAPPSAGAFPILELRQYTLHDGKRDTLIDLFEREFIEPQEVLGMKVMGTFRDLDRPNRFVWLRGFTDMDRRLTGLSAFYGGPAWQEHREAANATMVDSDNVLLLHAPNASAAFKPSAARPGLGEKRPAGLIVATILYLRSSPVEAGQIFGAKVRPRLEKAGVPVLAWFLPETAANNFPRLPVRAGERTLVWFARFKDEADRSAHAKQVAAAQSDLAPLLERPPEVLRLAPTERSELR